MVRRGAVGLRNVAGSISAIAHKASDLIAEKQSTAMICALFRALLENNPATIRAMLTEAEPSRATLAAPAAALLADKPPRRPRR